ncbi:MAG: flagellar motor protein MotB [Lachnospiraceae bacterium]|nr:flagellar motor protein MotB [bacterium]MDY5518446.1 flagellar motor protein MotB [Lachnospiraceae bacterium]
MARQKKEDPPAGSPAWMATFSDLMNLLLCFFVLLFSMSTVDAEKFQLVIASLQSHFSVLQGGASSIGDGEMVSAGINQLQYYDTFYNPDANSQGKGEFEESGQQLSADDSVIEKGDPGQNTGQTGEAPGVNKPSQDEQAGQSVTEQELTEEQLQEQYEQKGLEESEDMAEKIDKKAAKYGIQDKIEVSFNAQYVMITLNGSVLFDSGSEVIRKEALPLVDKVGRILDHYTANIIEVEGHTDNVPIHNGRFEDNNVLSMYRALSVADYLREVTSVDPAHIKSSGRGDYVPIADNATAEGRALNRRVVIKIYNSYNSDTE